MKNTIENEDLELRPSVIGWATPPFQYWLDLFYILLLSHYSANRFETQIPTPNPCM